jgi:carbon-monoxide dehydrogenase medium subunit
VSSQAAAALKLPRFQYRSPVSIDEALSLLAEHGEDAKVLAGGQSLMPLMALRLARPEVVVDVGRVGGLAEVAEHDGQLRIGSLVRERAAERSERVRRRAPLLADALPLIGHVAIRNRGTIGGSVAHSDPAAEIPAVVLATDAELVSRSNSRGERIINAADFFLGHFTNALEADELLTEVRIPAAKGVTGTSFLEAVRRHGDFAVVGAAVVVQMQEGNPHEIAAARIALIGVASTPIRRPDAERLLSGVAPTGDTINAAAAEAARDLDPPSDLHGSASYRKRVAEVLVRRALEQATERAGAAGG